METIEFGPGGMRHRLFIGPDSLGIPKLYIQKYSTSSSSWVGADIVVDQYGQHTAALDIQTAYISDSSDASYDGKIDVTISSLSGTCDHVHVYLDDYSMGSGPSHVIHNQEISFDTAVDLSVSLNGTTATVTATLTGTTGDIGLASGDFITLSSTGNTKLNGTHVVSSGNDDDSATAFTFSLTTDASDPLTSGPVASGTVGKLIKKTTKLDPVYEGVHKVVAFAAASDHKRVSEFASVQVATSMTG
jgi:hypothetical protein